MKLFMIAAATALVATQTFGQTVTREGTHGSSVINRSAENGVATTTSTRTGKNGGVYERTTVCVRGNCSTDWTLTDRKGRISSGVRSTVAGGGQSTTTATTRGSNGKIRTRVIDRTRSVTR